MLDDFFTKTLQCTLITRMQARFQSATIDPHAYFTFYSFNDILWDPVNISDFDFIHIAFTWS